MALLHYQAWGRAPGILTASERALKAATQPGALLQSHTKRSSLLDAVFAQELAVFFLKGAAAMVFLLGVHVFEEGVELARAHRKRAVAALPTSHDQNAVISLPARRVIA
jgi:hypothetical protein